MTFFITWPPDLKISARPDTARKPSTWSRAAPALMRRGTAGVDGDGAAERAGGVAAPQLGGIHRLEGELLVVLLQQLGDVGHRRAGPRGHHQLGGLVERDAGEAARVDLRRRLDRAPEPALRAVAEDLDRALLFQRVPHGGEDVVLVARLQGVHRTLEARQAAKGKAAKRLGGEALRPTRPGPAPACGERGARASRGARPRSSRGACRRRGASLGRR